MRSWVDYLATHDSCSRKGRSGMRKLPKVQPAVLRRLTHSQYNNTVRDLLGDDSNLAAQFPPEDFVNGFKDQSSRRAYRRCWRRRTAPRPRNWRATHFAAATLSG